ncbi:hypothetical protein [Salinisphaera hydrothermalis]|uniref:Uncharacterized protein n=1 Tax=Salinisphaera hydrothermalis (strain C41B8) TaxID=1304275 RepID=A0A084IMX6_SALHC|nr:hypothetical protein [Salinisphaera hydrothermalis]KEZ78060.1 hypothetical protein C41B8_07187 [Salinisphaera hydrothermalis C41B8]
MIWLLALVIVAFVVVGFLAVRLGQAQQRLAILEAEVARLGRDLQIEDREFESLMAEIGGSRIVIELTEPMALAREHSRWIGALSGVAPRLIRRRVYDEAATQVKQVLAERSVAAEVNVFHPSGS